MALVIVWMRPPRYEAEVLLGGDAGEPVRRAMSDDRLVPLIDEHRLYEGEPTSLDRMRADFAFDAGRLAFRHRSESAARAVVSSIAARLKAEGVPTREGCPVRAIRELPTVAILSAIGVGAGLAGLFSARHYWRQVMGL